MPPKQKEVKKGPSYKAGTPLKDIVSADVKEPPREPRSIKYPQTFPQIPKNHAAQHLEFEQWPTEEAVKSHDFALHSDHKFVDTFHENIKSYLNHESVHGWLSFTDIHEEEEQASIASQKKVEEGKQVKGNVVIETYMRMETEEETQKRLKEEAQKAEKAAKDKKKGKKQEAKDESPIQVSDVAMSDILTDSRLPSATVWIGSQLQIIKQRNLIDVNNHEQIWKKIYPQENGVPILNKSGKYWVKLYYMGKVVKVEVDDRVPVDQEGKIMLPTSAKFNEKWTLIISKAILKFMAKVASKDEMVGNGLVAYALLGMVSEKISLHAFKDWEKIEEYLSNEHYLSRDIVLSCYSRTKQHIIEQKKETGQVTRKTIKTGIHKEMNEEEEEADGQFEQEQEKIDEIKKEGDEILEEAHDVFQAPLHRQQGPPTITGYSYCLGDYFDNQAFNMVFSQEKSPRQIRLRHEYNELCKITLSNKGRQEKLEYRRKKKELKEKLSVEEKKRMELINKPAVQYHFLKLLSKVGIQCEYGEKQILLAKKCVVNKLNQPPNYDIPMQKQEKQSKSFQSFSVIKYKEQSELHPNLDDFSSIPNIVDLLQRKEVGTWIKDHDFLEIFQEIQVLYNPNMFHERKVEEIKAGRAGSWTYDEGKQIVVIEGAKEAEKEKHHVQEQHDHQVHHQRASLLFGFSYQKSEYDTLNSPYTMIQKFDFSTFRCTSTVTTLSSPICSTLVPLSSNMNSVFKLYTMAKGSYLYYLSCPLPIKLISIADYLTEYEGYHKKQIPIEYPSMESKGSFIIGRIRIKAEGEEEEVVIAKVAGWREDILSWLSYKLVAIDAATEERTEGVIEKVNHKAMMAYQYSRFVIPPKSEFYLLLECTPAENVPEGTIDLALYLQSSSLIPELLEQVQPIKYVEKYQPNKYGLIFRERLFSNVDNNISFGIKIMEGEEIQGGGATDKKAAKKGGKQEIAAIEYLQKPLSEKREIFLKFMEGPNIIYEASGINEINIANIHLHSTKANPGKQYSIELYFDLRVWPEATLRNEHTQKLIWSMIISAQDSVALVRNTQQQDKEKLTRKSWEDAEPGRAERAKKARRKFLIEMKKENGEHLTEEEQLILNAPRLTKKQILEEQKKNQEKKGKGGKKDDKKQGKDVKKEQVVQEKVVQRSPPKSKDNFMVEIKEFLQILQNCTVKSISLAQNEESHIRTQEQIRSLKESALMSHEDRVSKLIRNIEKRQTMKLWQKDRKEQIQIFLSETKKEFKQKIEKYIEWRTTDIEKDKSRQEKQKLLVDIILQQKPTISEVDLKKNLNEYKQLASHNPHLYEVGDQVRKNIRIFNVTDKMAAHLTAWEVQELKAINEQIKKDGIQGIDSEIVRQVKEMLEEVEKNPALVAEKQAELKKGGKKGGKK